MPTRSYSPLADRLRPESLDQVVGQQHLLGPGKILRNIIKTGQIPNMIFYGPSGVGKTTVARIIASTTRKKLHQLNATSIGTAEIKEVLAQKNTLAALDGILLYLDEIQYLNKKQQQLLLEYVENGDITLIASTTENPHFYVYPALLSRSTVFEFLPIPKQEAERAVVQAFARLESATSLSFQLEDGVTAHIASACGGDLRKSLNTVELCGVAAQDTDSPTVKQVTLELARSLTQTSSLRYDREGDRHYDLLSALQKSIRGSDPDASVHYLACLLAAGDLLSPCRRLLVIACEDIGLAYPAAIVTVKACVDTALQLGLPEARIPLAQATVLLATAPKSNSAYLALDAALANVKAGKGGSIPRHLQNKHCDDVTASPNQPTYRYPHDAPHHYLPQQYLPDDLLGATYYEYGDNKIEQAAKAYWERIKQTHAPSQE